MAFIDRFDKCEERWNTWHHISYTKPYRANLGRGLIGAEYSRDHPFILGSICGRIRFASSTFQDLGTAYL